MSVGLNILIRHSFTDLGIWIMAYRYHDRNYFKRYLLLGQGPDFRIILLKCNSNAPLLKLLKWFGSTEQNDRLSTVYLKDISS